MTHPLKDKTIAVLPFVNRSNNEDNEHLCDGITEEIINALAQLAPLKVTSRTSAFFFKNQKLPLKEIGEQLGVSTILEGSVRISGKTIRITAQLIEVEEDFHYWSNTWDRKLENIFDLQDEISLLIAEKLREQIGHFELNDRLINFTTQDYEAYECTLKAKYHENKWSVPDTQTAIELYLKALEYDPNYPDALIGLANCYSFLGMISELSFQEAWDKTKMYTQQAQLNGANKSDVYYQLSNYSFFVNCDFNDAFHKMSLAVEYGHNKSNAQQFLSFLYTLKNDKEKAQYHLNLSLKIDPLSPNNLFFEGYYHYMFHNYSIANQKLDECLAINPGNLPAHSVKILCLICLKQYNEALHYFDKIDSSLYNLEDEIGAKALAYSQLGNEAETLAALNELEQLSIKPDGFTADSYRFVYFAINNKYDLAFDWIDQAIQNKSTLLYLRFSDPNVRSLESDSRYAYYFDKLFVSASLNIPVKEKKQLMNDESILRYSSLLSSYMQEDKLYLDASLSLRSLAVKMDIQVNQLSWLLNHQIGKNFNEYVNTYRVQAFKDIVTNQNHHHLTIEALAYECGFNSKTVFNTYFKKIIGSTPRQYIKSALKD